MNMIKLFIALMLVIFLGIYYVVVIEAQLTTRFLVQLERQAAQLTRQEKVLPDGLHFVYLEGGQGETLMLLHGFAADKEHFVRVAQRLTSHYHVIIPDLVGFGESSRPNNADYSAKAQAERLHLLVHTLGITNLHLGGNSMGGQIALAYTAAYPSEVGSLWLLAPAGIWSAPDSELATLIKRQQTNPLFIKTEEDFANTYHFAMSQPPFLPRSIKNMLAKPVIENEALSEVIFNQIVVDSVEKRVTGLLTPTLIVWGDEDRVLHPATAELLHRLMPNSQVKIMKGIGHLPMLESVKESAEDYLRFREMVAERKVKPVSSFSLSVN